MLIANESATADAHRALMLYGDPGDHCRMIAFACCRLVERACTSYDAENDQPTVPVLLDLGARLINSAGAASLLTLTGYWATSAHCIRDLTELGQLLEFFRYQPAEIARWADMAGKDRHKVFGFNKVHQLMRDLEGKNPLWKEWFDDFSNLGSHPSKDAFAFQWSGDQKLIGPTADAGRFKNFIPAIAFATFTATDQFVRTLDSVLPPGKALQQRFPVEFATFGSGAVLFTDVTRDQIVAAWR